MSLCNQCPNNCGVDRNIKCGFCASGEKLKIAKYSLHPFEEPTISGTNGSGTIFFCGCSLKCVFCQNYDVSRNLVGKEISTNELCDIFKILEDRGAHNINLVNPTHYSSQILDALDHYRPNLPIVWNTHGYETIETLEKINPYVNVYLTDFKYFSSDVSFRYTGKRNYFEVALKALEFMVNNKKTELYEGLLKNGVIVRHLILPLNTADSVELLTRIRPYFSSDVTLSLMAQYTPFGKIDNFPELKRKITHREYKKVLDKVIELGYENVFIQDDKSSSEQYIPTLDF